MFTTDTVRDLSGSYVTSTVNKPESILGKGQVYNFNGDDVVSETVGEICITDQLNAGLGPILEKLTELEESNKILRASVDLAYAQLQKLHEEQRQLIHASELQRIQEAFEQHHSGVSPQLELAGLTINELRAIRGLSPKSEPQAAVEEEVDRSSPVSTKENAEMEQVLGLYQSSPVYVQQAVSITVGMLATLICRGLWGKIFGKKKFLSPFAERILTKLSRPAQTSDGLLTFGGIRLDGHGLIRVNEIVVNDFLTKKERKTVLAKWKERDAEVAANNKQKQLAQASVALGLLASHNELYDEVDELQEEYA